MIGTNPLSYLPIRKLRRKQSVVNMVQNIPIYRREDFGDLYEKLFTPVIYTALL